MRSFSRHLSEKAHQLLVFLTDWYHFMIKNLIKTALALYIISVTARADISLRKCTLLPITDNLDSAIGYPVYSQIEETLKISNWCEYKSSSELINILNRYRHNLRTHLDDPKVIQVLAQKLNSGSIIRVKLTPEIKGITVEMDVLLENGDDVVFSEKVLLDKNDIDLIVQTIKNWLEIYQTNIPYDGRVIGVLGEQITIDAGQNRSVVVGNEFIVRRLKHKKKHPLLKKVVEWETSKVASGKIHSIAESQSLGTVKVFNQPTAIQTGDWIVIDRSKRDMTEEVTEAEVKRNEFGKLGQATLTLDVNNAKSSSSGGSSSANQATGLLFGFDLDFEVWITREYFAEVEFARRTGTLSGAQDLDATFGKTKLLVGYKYLPMGFFYGPQIDLYFGKSTYLYEITSSQTAGIGDTTFEGFTLGLKGNIPFAKEFRVFTKVEFMLFGEMSDNSGFYGSSSKTSNLEFEVGIKYAYNSIYDLHLSLERISNKANLGGSFSSVRNESSVIKGGILLSF